MYRMEDKLFYELSDEELLGIIGIGEADGEPDEGKIAVMNVIKNRVTKEGWFLDRGIFKILYRKYPATILKNALVKERFIYQFSSFNEFDPNRIKLKNLVDKKDFFLKDIAKSIISGKISDNTNNACYYYADYIHQPSWTKKMTVTTKIGKHIFLKEDIN